LTKLSLLITSLVCFFIRADNLQRVLFVVGSCHPNGAKIRSFWNGLLPPKWARIQLSVSTLIITHIGRGLSDCEEGNHSHYFQGVARCHPDTGLKPMLCYTNTVAW
jgi:hypothetical protein